MNNREAIPYHEAGHAVAAYIFGRHLNYVSIRPEPSLGRPGSTSLSPSTNELINNSKFRNDRDAIEHELIVILAGQAAETCYDRYAFDPRGEETEDTSKARDVVCLMLGDDVREDEYYEKQNKLLAQMYEKACDLIEKHWSTIEALADVLQKQGDLSGEEATEIINAHLRSEQA